MTTLFKRYALLSSKLIFRSIKAASVIGCCFSFLCVQGQEPYSFQRMGYDIGTYEDNINIVNTEDGSFHLLTSSIDFIGDNWRYLSYKLDNSLNLSVFNLIDGDSTAYGFGSRSSSFYDAPRNKIISSGFDFLKEDAIIYSQDNSIAILNEIIRFEKPGYNSFRQGKLINGKYVSIGYSRIIDDGQMWLVQTDTNGLILWEKDYGTVEYDDGYAVCESVNNDLFLLGTSRGYGSEPGFYNQALLIKTDSLGNEEWRTTWGGYYNDCANNLAVTDDGGVIACGCISEESGGNSNIAQGYIRKMDAQGNLVWDKTYDWESVLDGGSFHSFSTSRVLENGNIIVVGFGARPNIDTTASRNVPCAVVFDKNGNVLMERSYTSLVGGFSSAVFQDIQPTSDGGFIAGGTYYPRQGDTGNQDAFIVKLDERGCEFAECQPALAVNEIVVEGNVFSAYPNPTTGIINFDSKGAEGSIYIYDLRGQLVSILNIKEDQELLSFDGNNLSSGIYIASFKAMDNTTQTLRIVKQ